MEYKFGTAGKIYKLARSLHDFGMPGEEIMITIRQTLEHQDEPVDDIKMFTLCLPSVY